MPCSSSSSPAIGIAILTGQIGGFHGVPVPSRLQERAPGHLRADPDQRADVDGEEDEGEDVGRPAWRAATAPRRSDRCAHGRAAAARSRRRADRRRRTGRPSSRWPRRSPARTAARHHLVENGERDDDDGGAPEPGDPGVDAGRWRRRSAPARIARLVLLRPLGAPRRRSCNDAQVLEPGELRVVGLLGERRLLRPVFPGLRAPARAS